MNLSFSSDRSALLLAGQKTGDQGDYIGLRLSADDLSTQFDAHSILDGKEFTKGLPRRPGRGHQARSGPF